MPEDGPSLIPLKTTIAAASAAMLDHLLDVESRAQNNDAGLDPNLIAQVDRSLSVCMVSSLQTVR